MCLRKAATQAQRRRPQQRCHTCSVRVSAPTWPTNIWLPLDVQTCSTCVPVHVPAHARRVLTGNITGVKSAALR